MRYRLEGVSECGESLQNEKFLLINHYLRGFVLAIRMRLESCMN